MKSYLLNGTALLAALFAVPAMADTVKAPEAPVAADVQEVVVYGQGQSRQVQALKEADLALSVPGTSPLKALDKLPGVSFQSADPFGAYEWSTRISVRGFNQNQLGFTLDGVPLGDMSYGNHNGLHISRAIISENLGRAELSQGAGSLETASTSNLGGTLKFTSLAPLDVMGGTLAATYGSDSTHRVFGRFETGKLESLGGLRATLSVMDAKADKWKGGSEQKQRQYNAKAVLPIGEGDLTGFFNRSERREQDYQDMSFEMLNRLGRNWDNTQPNYALAIAAGDAYQRGTALPNPFKTVDDAYYYGAGVRDDNLYGLSLNLPVVENLTFKGSVYGHNNKGQGLWATPYVASPGYDKLVVSNVAPLSIRTTEYKVDRLGGMASLTYVYGDHEISGGFWVEKNEFEQARRFYAETRNAPSRNPLDFQSNPFRTQWEYGFETSTLQAYVQDVWTVSEALKINFGFKALKVENQVRTIVGNALNGKIESQDSFLPQVGAVYAVNDNIELFGSYTENMAAYVSAATAGPFSSQSATVFAEVKKGLKPETSKTLEGGFRLKTDRFTGVVAAYHVDFNNRILAVTKGTSIVGNAAVLSNVGSVKTIGLEAAGTLRLTDTLKVAAAYTYNDSKYQSDVVTSSGPVNTKDKTVVNTPKHLFNAELAYDDGQLFGTLSTNFTGVRYYTYTNLGGKVDSSLVSDLTLGYRFKGEILDKTSIQLNVTNLMDVDYISTVGSGGFTNSDTAGTTMTLLPGAPRQIFVTVRKQF